MRLNLYYYNLFFSPSELNTNVFITFDWKQRFRFLKGMLGEVEGFRLMISVISAYEVTIGESARVGASVTVVTAADVPVDVTEGSAGRAGTGLVMFMGM